MNLKYLATVLLLCITWYIVHKYDMHTILSELETSRTFSNSYHSMLDRWNQETSRNLSNSYHSMPDIWNQTNAGYTVDCCNGVPDTKYWPQRHLVGHDLITDEGNVTYESDDLRKLSFQNIFKDKIWAPLKDQPASGPGSTVEATKRLFITLNCVLENLKVVLKKPRISILDIPCGDLSWMSLFLTNRTDVDYEGRDIVPDIIERNKKLYADRNWSFGVQDIVAEPLSQSYDLIFSRDMTMHLTTGDTMKVLHHFSSSGSHFVMLTTFPGAEEGREVISRGVRYRPQNLEGRPYSLIQPLCARPDRVNLKYNALWRLPLKQTPSTGDTGKQYLTRIEQKT